MGASAARAYDLRMLLGVDVGGTFTDAVLVAADGALHSAKVPTTPADQGVGVLECVRQVLARGRRIARGRGRGSRMA